MEITLPRFIVPINPFQSQEKASFDSSNHSGSARTACMRSPCVSLGKETTSLAMNIGNLVL
jgi:hypothetical protein